MGKPAESVVLDEDVQEELRKLAHESEATTSIERGLADLDAGRTRTTVELIAHLQEQRRARRG